MENDINQNNLNDKIKIESQEEFQTKNKQEKLLSFINKFKSINVKENINESEIQAKKEEKPENFSDKSIKKCLAAVKLFKSMDMAKNDNNPVEIIDNIFIGSIGAAMNRKGLEENKITHIIVAAQSLTEYYPEVFKYKKFNLLDSLSQEITSCFEEAFEFIEDCIINNGKVLVHCFAGISRSSTIIISYMIKKYKFTLDKALEICKAKREKINPNAGFRMQLKRYEETLLK